MPNYLVTYDLNRPGQRYKAVEAYLRQQQAYAKVLETVWIIQSPKASSVIRDDLMKIVDDGDRLLVAEVRHCQGYNIPNDAWAVVESLRAHL